ncbi:glycine cleavage system aminomethyltransferase T [Halorubrum californiense DSM 19288]|uniref:Probable aminomethyltransferase n=1 Tax=Halorubrum californiense DSM 19288 TaxID=1227465 RepID=M0EAK7_9EURY|nr:MULTISPECIES: glycine cleavage system aminomethyltransferase GcvT [Halorubrum]ELZ44800.1 glycine cleavage system aminomethyltransferase T [Halorubrum californiense DSM 19288]TKX64747.1 glycine cleavage system protein T [Halorubrum sp. GN11GM_10-3_MGM]
MTDRLPPLHDAHDARGAKFTDFGGWQMPVEFDSIRTEHAAVRESVGVFDVSHMGEVEVSGPDATALMNRLTTNDVRALDPGDSQYAAITNEEGVLLDDTVVYRLPDGTAAGEAAASLADLEDAHDGDLDAPSGDPAYLFVPNAGHDGQMYDRWTAHRDEWDLDATVANATDDWAMLAVQGPDAADALDEATPRDRVVDLSKFEATTAAVAGTESWVARTGYTGEDGFELMCPADDAEAVWDAFVDDREAQPCGLGARDTLRTEMGFLLSGQDFDPENEPRTPYEARIGFVVKLDTEFVGRDALETQKGEGVDEKFVGVRLLERGVPRNGYAVTDGDLTRVGKLTSGTMSPTLDEPIGLGYLHKSFADAGTEVSVVVRGDEKRAEVVIPPFLDR